MVWWLVKILSNVIEKKPVWPKKIEIALWIQSIIFVVIYDPINIVSGLCGGDWKEKKNH